MKHVLPLLTLLIATSTALAQFDDAVSTASTFSEAGKVSLEVIPAKARRGEVVTVRLTMTPNAGAWTYPTQPTNPKQDERNKIPFPPPGDLIFVGKVVDPQGAKLKPGTSAEYFPKSATWDLTAVVSPEAKPGTIAVTLDKVHLQFCVQGKKELCFYSDPKLPPKASLEISSEPPLSVPTQFEAAVKDALAAKTLPAPAVNPKSSPEEAVRTFATQKIAVSLETYAADLAGIRELISPIDSAGSSSLLGLMTTAALWGFISLVTPCVFPMIPITVSIFLKQSHQSTAQTLKLASVYCLTIIVVLGLSAFALLKFFVTLSVNPAMNLFLGGLFVIFALSLFGWYDLTLPQGMLRFTQKRQGSGGVVGTMFGALAFTIIGFTCVAPFLGGFAGLASSGNYNTVELILGALSFAAAFASPFFVLALFPRLLKTLPRSGGWLDSVKAVMGFLELAAALKFLRTAEIGWQTKPEYFTYDIVLGGWVAILLASALYLLNVFRLPHDEERPNIGVPRLIFALLFLGLSIYLFPALFKGHDGKRQRPAGVVYAWIDSFLLPEPNRESANELPFTTDLKAALDEARREEARTGKPSLVFVDFTGVTCTNCKYNENEVFTNPAVKELLKRFHLVQLYTDWVPEQAYTNPPSQDQRSEEALLNRRFKEKVFRTEQLPLYVILDPLLTGGVKVAGVYDAGKINNVTDFAAFLRDALDNAAKP